MENKPQKEELKIVSRPSNEEIQEDEVGNLRASEEPLPDENRIVSTATPSSEDPSNENMGMETKPIEKK